MNSAKSNRSGRPSMVLCLALVLSLALGFLVSGPLVTSADGVPLPEVVRESGERPADPTPRVGINEEGCGYATIQAAVDAAVSGDVIKAGAGTYLERVNIDGRDITVAGGYAGDCNTYIAGTTIVDGTLAQLDSVFDVTGSTVTLRDLGITGGEASLGGGVDARSSSRVTLDSTSIYGNSASYGGGLYISSGCVVTLSNYSAVRDNTAALSGGGARVWGTLVGSDTQSDIDDNSASDGGGVALESGALILNGSDMSGNQATGVEGRGGGIFAIGGVITMTGNAWIFDGNTAHDGAGIYADGTTVNMHSAVVGGNNATNNGGGVHLTDDSLLVATSTDIGLDQPGRGNQAVLGGGIYAITSTVDLRGNFYNNYASEGGAGIYAEASTLYLTGVSIGGPGEDEPNQLGPAGYYGAGLHLEGGTHATLDDCVLSSNVFQATVASHGGGAYVSNGSVMTLTNSTVENHYAPSATQGRGAGIYINYATVNLEDSQVLSNTAVGAGGGIRLWGSSILNVTGGSVISGNRALNGNGGGLGTAATFGTPDINITDATLAHNSASGDGGAIHLEVGTLDLRGWWDISHNEAGGDGGGIAVIDTGDAELRVTGGAAASRLFNNSALSGDGGGLYVGNTDHVELYSPDGYPLLLADNTAAGNGGLACADNGGFLDVWGTADISGNSAGGAGGAFYLQDGSSLWLHNAASLIPSLVGNAANDGGAIYAQDSPRVECEGATFGGLDKGNYANAGSGGAAYLKNSTFDASNCTFRGGEATSNGGAIAAYDSNLTIGADFSECTGRCSQFMGNTADSDSTVGGDDYGGAIFLDSSKLEMDHTILQNNSAWRGGAMYQAGGGGPSGEVRNSLFYNNNVGSNTGAAIRVYEGAFTLTHVTLAGNTGPAPACSMGVAAASVVANSIAWGNPNGGFDGTFVDTSCNIDQSGNVGSEQDPLFVAPGTGENYHLHGGSPARDACSTGLPTDLDNVARPVGNHYDMGAYEFNGYRIYLPLVMRSGG